MNTTGHIKVKLPQLSMQSVEKSMRSSIRSVNFICDYSNSPPKTRKNAPSRGSISTPLNQRYQFINQVESSFNDQELFSAQQRSVQRSLQRCENIPTEKIEKIDKLTSSIKVISGEKSLSMSNQIKHKCEPYINQQKSTKRKQQESESVESILKKKIQDRIQEIYNQVQKMLQMHKGYQRNQDKKNVLIQLVKLKKDFKLVNQDYNEFYAGPCQLLTEMDDRMIQLRKLFESKKADKRQLDYKLFENQEITLIIPTETDEQQLNIVQLEDQEYFQTKTDKNADDMTDCSPSNSSTRKVSQIMHRTKSKKYSIQPIQITTQQTQQTIPSIPRKTNSKASLSPSSIPESPSTTTSRKQKLHAQQILQQKLQLPSSPLISEQTTEFQEDKAKILKQELQRSQSKLISRKTTLDHQSIKPKISRRSSQVALMVVSEQSDNEQKQISQNLEIIDQEQQKQSDQTQLPQEQSQIVKQKSFKEIIENHKQEKLEKHKEYIHFDSKELIKNITQKRRESASKRLNQVIQTLTQCDFIYDETLLIKNRRNKSLISWDDDIYSILNNQFQFL